MSFQLPGVFDTTAPHSVAPSTATVDVGDQMQRTLDHVGQALEMHDKSEDAIADKDAAKVEVEALGRYEPERAKRAAGYDGSTPGYASGEIKAFDEATAEYRQMAVPPRVQQQINRRLDERRLKISADAIGIEAAKRGELESQRRSAIDMADDSQVMIKLAPQIQAATSGVRDSWDGHSAGYATGVQKAYDDAVKPVLDGLPEAQRLRLQAHYQAQGNEIFANAMEKEDAGREGHLAKSFTDTADAAANLTRSNPDSLKSNLAMVDQSSGALPGPMKDKAVRAAKEQVYMGRIAGLVDGGRIDEAKAELPTYAGAMDPDKYDQMAATITRGEARQKTTDYAAQAAMQSQADAYLDGIVTGNAQPRPDDGQIAAALGNEGLFKFREQEKRTQMATARMGDFGVLSPDQMEQRIQAQSALAASGGPEYDNNQKILDAMAKARDGQLKARATDPAGWAAAGDGTVNDPSTRIANAWARSQSDPDPQVRALATSEYVDATLARQRLAGITTPAVLPVPVAKAWVQAIHDAPDDKAKGDAILGLASQIQQWGHARPLIMADLQRAGLSAETGVVAGELVDHPNLMRAYAAGGTELKTWKPKDKDALVGTVKSAMAPLDATLSADAGSAQLRGARYSVIATAAAGLMAQGSNRDDAINQATGAYLSQYKFTSTWRMPAGLADQQVSNIPDPNHDLGTIGMKGWGAVGVGVKYLMSDLEALGHYRGAPLSDNEPEAEAKYNTIRAKGRWVTRDDDGGLQLMVPNVLDGTWAVVKDKQGKDLSYSWAELISRAKKGQ